MLCLLFRNSAEVDLLQVCATLNEWRKTKPPIGTCQAVMRLEARSQEKIWWSWRGLNPRPSDCQSDALPTALQPHAGCILTRITHKCLLRRPMLSPGSAFLVRPPRRTAASTPASPSLARSPGGLRSQPPRYDIHRCSGLSPAFRESQGNHRALKAC